MLIRIPRGWEIPEREATPESVYRERRTLLKGLGLAAIGAALPASLKARSEAPPAAAPPATVPGRYPAARSPRYTLDRPVTPEEVASRNNVFDEITLERDQVWKVATGFPTSPWRIHIGGAVQKPLTLDVDDLIGRMALEERLYRFRCVEAWAMAVPWTGFPFKKLIELAQPLAKAKYVRMVTCASPERMPGWYASKRVFPYHEALSLKEAENELTLLATGIYGHPLPMQHGAPLRLVVPWKYGLKNIKSIVAFQFTEEKPGTFWTDHAPQSYTFESNVDPAVPRPWPQGEERMIDTGETRKTLPYNGYAEHVAHLYA
ncbi:MAG TPA: protein-methionine-sulfoxide reductase catalytic subunit MsrP [Thermoanaerobaculia bacterium]|nr:protein-methionine-sulfoxide reductase catalytic subunit MsrP [Thermoanaerobaculia bacterium]